MALHYPTEKLSRIKMSERIRCLLFVDSYSTHIRRFPTIYSIHRQSHRIQNRLSIKWHRLGVVSVVAVESNKDTFRQVSSKQNQLAKMFICVTNGGKLALFVKVSQRLSSPMVIRTRLYHRSLLAEAVLRSPMLSLSPPALPPTS